MKNLDDIGAFYAGADNDPSAVTLSKDFVERYAKNWKAHSLCDFIIRCKTFSMLHQETLLLLNFLSRRAKGAILEIGSYTGAATVALAQGVKDRGKGNALVTIEAGGAYAHPEV